MGNSKAVERKIPLNEKAAQWLGSQDLSRPVLSNMAASELPFQRWFHFKEAFAPEFVAKVIEGLPYDPQHIVDPFAGSGTTAITSRLLGKRSTSIEVSPLMADLVRAKITAVSAAKFREAVNIVLRRLRPTERDQLLPKLMPPTFTEPGVKGRYIFPMEVFALARAILRRSKKLDEPEARLIKIALASCLVGNSNVRVNGKGRRYRSNWQSKEPTANGLMWAFEKACNRICEDLLDFALLPHGQQSVLQGDSRAMLGRIDWADTVICSPPYPNSFDYTDVYNVELWMLGYLQSPEDNHALRADTVRSHVQYRWPSADGLLKDLGSSTLQETLSDLVDRKDQLWDRNIPDMVAHYFNDMRKVFDSATRFLEPRGQVIFAVGNSRYANVTIDVPKILAEIVQPLGFERCREEAVRSMRTSAQHGGQNELAETAVSFILKGGGS
ncbi:site-specific DNA-methyltransferase [Roseobacter sp. YSTF-M11]|uniref:Site-specific DNA-methyltransferase n=1 Tax=Roseobacter insulae TaxID=2859783 RepID=A0A9X1JWP7_9RHOB|nr:site-specific DNA-methyltransferase [Roseobacter insulae]MBW4706395.1 site-specific DNA-methyltransferase [Roseobacter insulae]